jgi:FKBP-type peptidyl-prolyl cis-trans isomerase FkpA
MKRLLLPIVAVLLAAGCGSDDGPSLAPTTSAPYSQTDLVVGTGTTAVPNTLVTVAYTGWLHDSGRADAKGTQFDSRPSFEFRLGTGNVIQGWHQGVSGMRIGGQRRLVIPPDLAYGNQSPGAPIPANATLVFDITLLNVQP